MLSRYFVMAVLLGFERVVKFNLVYLFTSLFVLVFVSILVGFLGYGLTGALAAFLIAQTLVVPLGLAWIRGSSNAARLTVESEMLEGWPLFRKSLAYGLKGHPAGVLVTFNQRFDIFLLGALAGPREVGLYAVAVAVAEIVWHVPMSVHLNLFPRVAADGADQGAKRLPRATRMTILLSVLVALVLFFFGKTAIRILFGASFLPASSSMLALLPGVVAVSAANVFESYFAGVDRRHYQSFSVAGSFALGLALCLLLIPRYGALGAALASTASYTLQMVVSVGLFRRIGKIDWRDFFLPRIVDIRDLIETFQALFKKEDRF